MSGASAGLKRFDVHAAVALSLLVQTVMSLLAACVVRVKQLARRSRELGGQSDAKEHLFDASGNLRHAWRRLVDALDRDANRHEHS